MFALNTDFYELTMAAGYFISGKVNDIATFELSVRRLPEKRNYLIAAGLAQAVEYLQSLQFEADDIDYLRSLKQFADTPSEFFDFLSELRFTGDLFALPEGTPVFASEPLAVVRAPIIQAQLVETCLLSNFAFQTSIASKAARCVHAAQGRSIVEFGSRRAHGPRAGILAARAAFVGGATGTSNTAAGKEFGIPVSGTAAHSWIMSFADERQAFCALQKVLGENTVFLLDTFDTIAAARLVTELGPPVWGVRLDSGDLPSLAREVRTILNEAGLRSAKIFATNDLDEYRITELLREGAPIDAFGVGTALSTSSDAPSLSAVYKLVELKRGSDVQYTAKFSDEKSTLPGAKQIFRAPDHDTLALQSECMGAIGSAPLVRPVLLGGSLLEPLPTLADTRAQTARNVALLPHALFDIHEQVHYPVEISARLAALDNTVRDEYQI